jgi:hypothetical protein
MVCLTALLWRMKGVGGGIDAGVSPFVSPNADDV